MKYPASMKIEDLMRAGQMHDPARIALYQAFYDGGRAMEAVKPSLLPVRGFETKAGERDSTSYKERLEYAPYIRRVAGFIDWMRAAVFFREPMIVVTGNADAGYWESMNDDATGDGTPLAGLMREAVLECQLHKRCWISCSFPGTTALVHDPETEEARLRLFRAREITDWQTTNGVLEWVRCSGMDFLRPDAEPWKKPDRERHRWTFMDSEAMAIYEGIRLLKNDAPSVPGSQSGFTSKDAKRIALLPYAGGLPLFVCEYGSGQWIMEATFDVAKAMFQCDANIEHLRDKMAFRILKLNVDRAVIADMILPDLCAMVLRPGEDAQFIGPGADLLAPLFQDAEKLRRDLMESIHASAQNAANIPQAGRLSGEAVQEMREPLRILLWSFAWPVLQAFTKAIKHIATLRGEDPNAVEIVGLDAYNVDMDDADGEILGEEDEDGEAGRSGAESDAE